MARFCFVYKLAATYVTMENMAWEQPKLRPLLLVGVGLALALAGGIWIWDRTHSAPVTDTIPVVKLPQTNPTTTPVVLEKPPRTYMEYVLKRYPSFPTTQPLKGVLPIKDAGHFVIPEPVYLDQRGVIWITRPDAEETQTLLGKVAREQVILTRERVLFAMWTILEVGEWSPHLIVEKGEGFALIDVNGMRAIGRGKAIGYDWRRGFPWGDKMLVVPTANGASVFTVDKLEEFASPALGEKSGDVQIQVDNKGLLAWMPPDGKQVGNGIARFLDNKWTMLPANQGWPAGIVHLIPLVDGSVTQIVAGEDETMKLNVVALDTPKLDTKQISLLVIQLGDADPAVRDKAYAELTRFGPSIFPIAETLMANAPPEAQDRLKALLRARISPLLGGMRIIDNKLKLVARLPDGGAAFYADRGVGIPVGENDETIVSPAWLSIRPGTAVQRLEAGMMKDLEPGKISLTAFGSEWIVTNEVSGPQRYIGGVWAPMLRKSERVDYTEMVGIDAAGRYIFRKPGEAGALVLDPTLPDPTPKLPAWVVELKAGTVGWNKDDWPAQKSGEHTWALGASAWKPMDDEKKEPFYYTADQVPALAEFTRPNLARAQVGKSTTRSTSGPTSAPTTQSVIGADEKPFFRGIDSAWYFDGKLSLKVLDKDGNETVWLMPPLASGEGEPKMVQTKNGTLYLFNQPGRIVQLTRTPNGAEPFRIDATFGRKIPNTINITRMWLDPFNRIVIAYDSNKLAILFPDGFIPPATQALMLVGDEEDE